MSSLQPKGRTRSSIAVNKLSSVDGVPYRTSRISATPFQYTFRVTPGQIFLRLHFYPASYRGFEKSLDLFTVKAGPFTLLRDFSASLTADGSGEKYVVKEFCLNVEVNAKLNATFSPSKSSKLKKVHAFVNGIEIISIPAGLYYTSDGELGARMVGLNNRFYIIENSTALEVVQRLNIGGGSISPIEDFGMFRRWSEDSKYLQESGVHRVSHLTNRIKYTNMPAFVAPPRLYHTAWKIGRGIRGNEMYKFTWKIPIDLGFGYLVRLHFCDFDAGMTESRQREFTIHINNHIAENKADLIRWSGGTDIPVYRDYLVMVKGEKEVRNYDLLISLQSVDELVFGLLNGLEVFKLSNPDNSLATPNPLFPRRASKIWNLKIPNLFSAFGQSNAVSTGMTIIIILLSIILYNLKESWEQSFIEEKNSLSAQDESSCRRFSLAEIMAVTQNFSDAFFIGKGGFGSVYKGSIPGISKTVAIKRLNPNSRQGAREFWAEVETLSKLHHIHLVSLIGYCNERKEMILVYDYMSSGTLADNLYKAARNGKDCVPLRWEQRLRICIGAARGLDYLHTGSEYGVIHRDVKDTNILLDENLVAKISDFGLSKLEKFTQSRSYVSTKIKGTFGYLDPDYFMTQNLTRKTDVYAFGIVMLVALSGRPAVDSRNPEEPRSLLSCFRDCIAEGEVDRIVDTSLRGKIPSNSLREFVKSVENCLQHQPKKRPTMAQVVANLESALEQQDSTIFSLRNSAPLVGQSSQIGTPESIKFVKSEVAHTDEERNQSKVAQLQDDIQCPVAQIDELSAMAPPNEETKSKHSQNLAFPVRGKPTWSGWPWKAARHRGKAMKTTELVSPNDLVPPSDSGPRFSIEDIRAATDNLVDGFAITNNGSWKFCIGFIQQLKMTVSIYQFHFEIFGREVLELCREIERLSRLRHPNLLSLIGYCYHEDENKIFIVYDHIGSISLDKHLYGTRNVLPWKCKLRICLGVAQGLGHLHGSLGQATIHHDLRAANILLDEDGNPKISLIGLYKVSHVHQLAKPSTKVQATGVEYLSPDSKTTDSQSFEKSDVCSFGLLLLEVLCCRRPIDSELDHDNGDRYLKHWVKNNIKTKKLHQILDFNSKREIAAACFAEFLRVAFSCLLVCETERPPMDDVIKKLESALKLQEQAEAMKQDFKGKGCDDGFNLEDIYHDISISNLADN
nr:receptor-like protein kinase FERONIA isoform X2 [Coffea arabica]